MKIANCEFCGKQFEQIRSSGKYCSPTCRVKSCQKRKIKETEQLAQPNETLVNEAINTNTTNINDNSGTGDNINKNTRLLKNASFDNGFNRKTAPGTSTNTKVIAQVSKFIIRNKTVVGLLFAGTAIYWGSKHLLNRPNSTKNENI